MKDQALTPDTHYTTGYTACHYTILNPLLASELLSEADESAA